MNRTRRTPQRPRGQRYRTDTAAPVASAQRGGTAADVLAWVGEDSSRAQQAIEDENARDKPRSTLLRTLVKLAGGADE